MAIMEIKAYPHCTLNAHWLRPYWIGICPDEHLVQLRGDLNPIQSNSEQYIYIIIMWVCIKYNLSLAMAAGQSWRRLNDKPVGRNFIRHKLARYILTYAVPTVTPSIHLLFPPPPLWDLSIILRQYCLSLSFIPFLFSTIGLLQVYRELLLLLVCCTCCLLKCSCGHN